MLKIKMKKIWQFALIMILFGFILGIPGIGLARVTGLTNADPLIGQPFLIADNITSAVPPTVAVAHNTNRNQFLVAYELGTGWFSLSLRDANGAYVWDPPIANMSFGEHPALAYNSARDEYLLVWQEQAGAWYDIRGIRLSHDGITPVGPAFDISTRPFDQLKPAVAYNPHGNFEDYLVVWEDIDTSWVPSNDEIWAQRVAGPQGGGLIGSNFMVVNSGGFWHSEPDVAYNLNMNEYMVVYTRQPSGGGQTDVYNRRITAAGILLAENSIDSSGKDQLHPAVATYRLNQQTPYFVVFEDYWNDGAGDIRGYLANKDGQSWRLVNIATVAGRHETTPDVTSSEGLGYTVVWAQHHPGSDPDWDIYGRRISDTGDLQPAFNVSVPTSGLFIAGHDEGLPVVAGGSPVAMAAWGGLFGATYDIGGRILGYQLFLPLAVRAP